MRFRSAVRWALTTAVVITLGMIAARYRLLDSWVVALTLCVIVGAAIAYGVWGATKPWDDLDE